MLHHLPGQADEEPHAHADHRTGEPGVRRTKQNGLIVDYVGVFRNLQKALAIYGAAQDGGGPGGTPIHDKGELVRQLREAIATTTAFCLERRIDPATIRDARGFEREKLKEDAVAALVVNDETQTAVLESGGCRGCAFQVALAGCRRFRVQPDLQRVQSRGRENSVGTSGRGHFGGDGQKWKRLLNRSIAADGYVMPPVSNDPARYIDLSQIDFEALKEQFDKGRKSHRSAKAPGQDRREVGPDGQAEPDPDRLP